MTGATISASPNPILHGPTDGKTTVTWDTHGNGSGKVYVSHDGSPEQLFASGDSGSEAVGWIKAGVTYKFSLYQDPSHKLLASTQVTHQK